MIVIQSGTQLGPYEIQARVGVGGMGEVYRAKDTRLGRIVAIKVLPSDLSRSPERRQRLEREARAISSLSHPNVCTLYDVGHQDGLDFLVMEYLEGETLEERLRKGPLPQNQVLRYGVEIADALAKAHRKGVVHRDLKPGNVMLTKSGAKLLDFGLATVVKQPAPVVVGLAELTTETKRLTEAGVILGTWQYMAPEQLEGNETDARTDIFALGTVLYEMTTGRPAFSGKSKASLIAAILTAEPPDITSLQQMAPLALDRVVKKCLEKDPHERWESAADLKSELQWIAELVPEAGGFPPHIAQRRLQRIFISIAALAVIALLGAGFWYWKGMRVNPAAVVRFSIPPPENNAFDGDLALSPDGKWLAFAAESGADLQRRIWVRALDSQVARPLPGTENTSNMPFWSPDSMHIGFFADGKLKQIHVTGGIPEDVCNAPSGFSATWNGSGVVLFGLPGKPLQRMDLRNCAIRPATTLDLPKEAPISGIIQAHPSFLPDGEHFLFAAKRSSGLQHLFDIYVGALDSEQQQLLIRNGSMPRYVPPGHLVFQRDGKLFAMEFDPQRLRTSGEVFPLVDEQVSFRRGSGAAAYSVSQNGVLVYQPQLSVVNQLQWVNRGGQQTGLLGKPGAYQHARLSLDGKKIAVARLDDLTHSGDIWIYEIARDTWTRFTFRSASGGGVACWSPDGRRIAYGHYPILPNLYEKATDSSGSEQTLLHWNTATVPDSWSPDGRYIVYESYDPQTSEDLWILPLFGNRTPVPFVQTPYKEVAAKISPDGKWLAYESNESGRFEVYVRPFPGPGQKWHVSSGGSAGAVNGSSEGPTWGRDGKELFYISAGWKLMAVPVRLRSTFEMGTPHPLFAFPEGFEYDVAPDAQQFLVTHSNSDKTPPPVNVVLNWTAELNYRK